MNNLINVTCSKDEIDELLRELQCLRQQKNKLIEKIEDLKTNKRNLANNVSRFNEYIKKIDDLVCCFNNHIESNEAGIRRILKIPKIPTTDQQQQESYTARTEGNPIRDKNNETYMNQTVPSGSIDVQQLVDRLEQFVDENQISKASIIQHIFGTSVKVNSFTYYVFKTVRKFKVNCLTNTAINRFEKIRRFLNSADRKQSFLKNRKVYNEKPVQTNKKPLVSLRNKYRCSIPHVKETLLRKYFQYNRYLSENEYIYLSKLLHLDVSSIKKWFEIKLKMCPLRVSTPSKFRQLLEFYQKNPENGDIDGLAQKVNLEKIYVQHWLYDHRITHKKFQEAAKNYKNSSKNNINTTAKSDPIETIDDDDEEAEELFINEADISVVENASFYLNGE